MALFIRFYPAYKIDDVLDEPFPRFYLLISNIIKIQAREQLSLIEAVRFPKLPRKEQNKVIARYQKHANPSTNNGTIGDREHFNRILQRLKKQ